MKVVREETKDKHLFYRIVALWAVCEGMLGGIIHGFNLPGTGLLVSSAAVTCISLIAWYFPVKGYILKATIIVAIIKMTLSPHSPPTAYLALFFQGVTGELIFAAKINFRVSCMLLAVLSLVESSIQRILVLTIVYGNGLWNAIDQFITKLTGDKTITNYSWYIALGYVSLHLIAGLVVGRFMGNLPSRSRETNRDSILPAEITGATELKSKQKRKWALLFTWLLLLGVYVQSAFEIGSPLLPASLPLQIIIRSLLIVFTWYFIAAPILSAWLKKWLAGKQYQLKDEVEAIVGIIPSTQQLLYQSWIQTNHTKGLRRVRLFARLALSRTIHTS